MATTYHDYEQQTTDQAKYDRLLLYIAELRVKQSGNASVSGAGMSVQFDGINMANLEKRRAELEDRIRRYGSGRSPISVANTNGGPR